MPLCYEMIAWLNLLNHLQYTIYTYRNVVYRTNGVVSILSKYTDPPYLTTTPAGSYPDSRRITRPAHASKEQHVVYRTKYYDSGIAPDVSLVFASTS